MTATVRNKFSVLAYAALLLGASSAMATTTCTGSSPTITCTNSAAISLNDTDASVVKATGGYPSTITFPTLAGTITAITVTLNGFNASGAPPSSSTTTSGLGILLVHTDSSKNLELMGAPGDAMETFNNITFNITDTASAFMPTSGDPCNGGSQLTAAPWIPPGVNGTSTNISMSYKPSSYFIGIVPTSYPAGAPTTINRAGPCSPATGTLMNTFGSDTAAGTWQLYVDDGLLDAISMTGGWSIEITISASLANTTTTLTSSLNPAFTSTPSNGVTLTAGVTSSGSVTGGTVTFMDGASTISGCGGIALSSGSAACNTSFTSEGFHDLSAKYSGTTSFNTSTGTLNEFVENHSTISGNTFCNAGAINVGNANVSGTDTQPYPSVINVSGYPVSTSVSTVSLVLNNLSMTDTSNMSMLLVSPDGVHALDFFDEVGGGLATSTTTVTFSDSGIVGPNGTGALASPTANYQPTSYRTSSTFHQAPAPAPQVPPIFRIAAPGGSTPNNFLETFNGATANGAWALYLYYQGNPNAASIANGWCLTVTPGTGATTTTTVTGVPNGVAPGGAATGSPVTVTATVKSAGNPVTSGQVTFTENGATVAGGPSTPVAIASGGTASFTTSSLVQGDHTILATYTDGASFNDSFSSYVQRVDTVPTVVDNAGVVSYCNAGSVAFPVGSLGPAFPNPSNINVANLNGTINAVTVSLNGYHESPSASFLDSVLIGPSGTKPASLDFFSGDGGGSGDGPFNLTFVDGASAVPTGSFGAGSYSPTSRNTTNTYTASTSGFYTPPSTYNYAAPSGTSTFTTVYRSTDPNGNWDLYFNVTGDSGGGGLSGWCLNFTENAVTGTGTTAHIGPAPSNHMVQGGTGSVTFSLLNNGDVSHNGPTGDPDGTLAHAMVVTGTLPTGLTLGTLPTGSPWNCTAVSLAITCTSTVAIAAESSYPLLTIPVNVASNAPATATVSGFTFVGAGMTGGTFSSDTITINPTPFLHLDKSAASTLTQGQTATWNLTVSNTAPNSSTVGTVTVIDTLPNGYGVSGTSGTNWSCGVISLTVTCTTTTPVAGGSSFPVIGITVNVPGNSPTSVTNNAVAFGGGSPTQTNSGNGATASSTVTVVQVPATINLNAASNNQSAPINTVLPTNLSVTVLDANSVAIVGATVTFTAPSSGASGTFAGGTNVKTATTISGGVATATVYTTNSIAGGPYSVNAAAGSISNNFSITNLGGPVITTNPTNTTVTAGATATFTAAASGSPTPTVQWQVSTDGGSTFNNVAGATTTTLSFATSAAMNGNKYRAVFSNTGGSATTTAATLTVNFAPTVTTNPVNQSVTAGSTATFTAAASGNPTPTVQWQVSTDGGATFNNVAGATTTTLSFTTTAGQNGNQYHAVFTNTVGTATTTAATLTVTAGPVITTNPSNQTVNSGATATFTAAATGTPTPTVQWQQSTDGGSTFTNIAGATTTTLSFTTAASQTGNKYRAVFTNTSGSATTTAATLTVNFAPTVTTNPVNQSVTAGSPVTFTAAASGNPTPTVQWQVSTDGGATFNNVAGATTTTLSFTTTAGQNGNQYHAVFTNTVGTATTTAATLTVTAGPVITTNPSNQTVNSGATATFTAAATGTPTPTVQWQVSTDGGSTFNNVAGATTTTLSFTTSAAMNGNKYRAVFTNTSGTATTTAATLTVNFAPTITTNPVNQSVSAGSTATFTAAASGNPTPTVQWQQSTDGGSTFTNIAGATTTTLSFTTAAGQNGNQYRAVFTNTAGTATTTAATLTVTAGPVITTNPSNQTVNSGATATFTAAATGTPTPTVQWQVSTDGGSTFNNVAGATTTTLSFTTSAAMNGNKYRAVFTNTSGTATTTAATLTVNFAPTITTNPVNQSVSAGSTATFTAAASGNPTPTVQWQQSTDGGSTFTNIAGATTTTLSFTTAAGQNGNQYRAVFTNTAGTATTTAATLTVTAGPVITTNPSNQTVNSGATATFTAAATGTPTPTVQWQVSTDGGSTFNNVAGATTTTLSFTTSAAMNGNKYRAVFTNTSGTATTTAATLTVNFAPTITTNPVNQSVTAGSTAIFAAAASGNPTPTVQWQVSTDGGATFNNVAGATTTTLSFTTTAGQNGNQYHAVFTNTVGTATTTAATLTVTGSPVITLNPSNQSVSAGATATFTAAATGTPTPTVQWQVSTDGGATFNNVAGATTTTLSFTANGAMTGNLYRAVFTNTGGTATTTAASLTVGKLAPVITWSNPADILFGGALGSAQLNATANVAGTFVYSPPAGTVLPLGPSALSVLFTPTDTADYTTASKTVTINVDPISGGGTPANLVVTYVLTRDPSTQNVVVAITVANSGGTDAGSVQINTATIGGTSTMASLPIMLGMVAAGGQTTTTVQFPATVGTSGSRAVLSIVGSSTAGAFGANGRVVLP